MEKEPEKVAADLKKLVRGDVFADILHRAAYSTDASIYQIVPACVVAPRDAGDIVAVVRYAGEHSIPVVARGAGSGVAGESLCSGIVFDMTRYMNKIVSVSNDGATAVCEPGVVLDDLNRLLSGYGRKIGPDPSTGNRATIGGCVANNSTGAHSLEYGYIGDYVESLEAVLADASLPAFKNDFDPKSSEETRVCSIAERCLDLLSGKEEAIRKALPGTRRNRSGYTIAGICHEGRIDMARLLAGSEGTLAVFTKIVLRSVKLPEAKALLQLEFESLEQAVSAVAIIVGTGASACELMDKSLIEMAREALPKYRDILPAGAAAVLLVEHTGQTNEQVRARIADTDSAVGAAASGRKVVFNAVEQARLWKSRKDAVPLLDRKKGKKHPVPFIEDVSVGNTRLGEYIAGLKEVGARYNIAMSFYGHAGDGELHVRPYLDLSDPAQVEKMQSIANDVFSLAWSLGGSISGEHADGLVRAAFIRRQYGEEFYRLLCGIKRIFDPQLLLNPGKIINRHADVMVRNLRARHDILTERLKSDLVFEQDELRFELGQCSGCGVCLSRESNLRMCPVFRSLGDELSSSRAKANVLRFWATGQLDERVFESAEFSKFLDLCVNCKACSLECPSGVDVSKLIGAARAEYVKRKGLRRAAFVLSHNRHLSRLGSLLEPASNFVMCLPITRWLLEKAAGLDKRRDMPLFAKGAFVKAGRKYLAVCDRIARPTDKVAYFVDTYGNYNDHELGFGVLDVLIHNDIEVILPKQRPVPLPAICYGDVRTARRDLAYNVEHLAKVIRQGYKIICSEPSAALCLQQELRHYVAGKDANLVSQNTFELMSYLLDLCKEGRLKPVGDSQKQRLLRRYVPRNEDGPSFVYHSPCHLSVVGGVGASIELLENICGIKAADIGSGCCGLAGTFGMQRKNYELSSRISDGLTEALESASVKYVLTECSACKMQIEHISNCVVSHPVKILAECYRVPVS
ncbi:MAG: FAD-linked oxidase C-terminal domain-containing protein [Planctomycetota bacterium]|jgi:FAD/FMN-containing dehydrogenase/Fe-S oxidoreductase